MQNTRWRSAGIVMGLLSFVAVIMLRQSATDQNSRDEASGRMEGSGVAYLPSFSELVASTSAIVLVTQSDVFSLGTIPPASSPPTPTGAYILPPPAPLAALMGVSAVVRYVFKSDGNLSTNQTIIYETFGVVPVTQRQIAFDGSSRFPVLWPEDTEFILFVDELGGESENYYIPFGPCGRVLTAEAATVSCSDSLRTVPSYMEGMSKSAFVGAVVNEINTPGPTSTDIPTDTPTATPTP